MVAKENKAYMHLTFGAGAVAILMAMLYVLVVPRLVENGVDGRVFYILLLPWGMTCAASLFGILRSSARVKGTRWGSTFEFGGPVVLFGLIVTGGFYLVPDSSFDLTMRFIGLRDALPSNARVQLDLGSDRRIEPIDIKGEANFKGIPARHRGRTVEAVILADGFSPGPQRFRLTSAVVYLQPRGASYVQVVHGHWLGTLDSTTRIVISEGGSGSAPIQADGNFVLRITSLMLHPIVRVRVLSQDTLLYDEYQAVQPSLTLTESIQ